MARLLHKHARIVVQRCYFVYVDLFVVGMIGVDQPVIFGGSKNRRHYEHAVLSSLRKFISQPGELGRGCGFSPVCRYIAEVDVFSGQIIGDLRDGQNKVNRGILLIKMYEIFQHGEGLVFRSVTEARSRTRPTAAIAVCTFTIKRGTSVRSAQNPIDAAQLIPP